MPRSVSSTLVSTEHAMRPVVTAVTYASCTVVALALGWAATCLTAPLWLVCAVPALALEASNLHYLRTHPLTTVGMIPIALFSLVPALVAMLVTARLPRIAAGLIQAALVLLVVLLAIFALYAVRLRRAYTTHPDVSPTAALIVLGGAVRNGRPCSTLARRLDVAARLWHEQPRRTIVVSGGATSPGAMTEAEAMATYLQQCGVEAQSVILESHARNTRENISLSCELLDGKGHRGQRCVVTSDYHLCRALRDGRAVGVELTPVAAPTPRTSAPQQWCREILTILSGR